MAITDKKISTTYANRDVASLGDRPNEDGLTAAQLKARFDQLPKEVIPQYNALIDELNDTVLPSKVDKADGKSLIADTEITRLLGIETGAEVNNISDVNATDLTDGGDTNLHTHDSRYYTETEMNALLNAKQPTLVSGANIKTVNSNSLLGSGDVLLNATSIPNTPSGNISATTVQGAINELDTEKADKLFATNLITNGDFSNGTTGWSGAYGTISVASNTLSVIGDGSNKDVLSSTDTTVSATTGQKIYVRYLARVTNGVCSSIASNIRGTTSGNLAVTTITSPAINTWYTLSGVATLSGLVGNIRIRPQHSYADAATANGKVMEVQYVSAINLTAIFGAGKEPSAIQMDNMLSTFPNSWFNGTAELVNIANLAQLKADKTQEAWITPTLLNGWIAETGYAVGYMKDQFGFVHIKGRVKSGTLGQPIFTLPVGYRPTNPLNYFPIYSQFNIYNGYVNSSGSIIVSSSANNTNVHLDAIIFKAEA